ncbi:hypothetical protein GF361_01020 [Candidatus Woesearchaeota archaeon]|nr:hypothetical protein [Candidatus Woesearchaeota archaeon]
MIEDYLKKAEEYRRMAENFLDKKISIQNKNPVKEEHNNLLRAKCYVGLANYYQNMALYGKEE